LAADFAAGFAAVLVAGFAAAGFAFDFTTVLVAGFAARLAVVLFTVFAVVFAAGLATVFVAAFDVFFSDDTGLTLDSLLFGSFTADESALPAISLEKSPGRFFSPIDLSLAKMFPHNLYAYINCSLWYGLVQFPTVNNISNPGITKTHVKFVQKNDDWV
jgi:hypothetical protein